MGSGCPYKSKVFCSWRVRRQAQWTSLVPERPLAFTTLKVGRAPPASQAAEATPQQGHRRGSFPPPPGRAPGRFYLQRPPWISRFPTRDHRAVTTGFRGLTVSFFPCGVLAVPWLHHEVSYVRPVVAESFAPSPRGVVRGPQLLVAQHASQTPRGVRRQSLGHQRSVAEFPHVLRRASAAAPWDSPEDPSYSPTIPRLLGPWARPTQEASAPAPSPPGAGPGSSLASPMAPGSSPPCTPPSRRQEAEASPLDTEEP